MAGLWDVWEGEDETISCVTILTTEPNDLMNSIHDRMPVVLPQDAESDWLAADPTPARNCASRIRRTIWMPTRFRRGSTIPATTIPRLSSRWTTSNRASASSVPDSCRGHGHCIGDAAAESTSEYSRSRLVPSASRRLYCSIFERYVRIVRFVRGSSTSSE